MTPQRVAFFGGSFDPPHLGHLAVARAARAALALDTVLFAPVGAQPLKPHGSTAPFEDRLAMTRLAIAGEGGFELSLADAPQPSAAPNYTFDTLEGLRAKLGPQDELFCLMGADSFFALRQWHRAAEIPFVAPLIVASRPGQPLDQLMSALPAGLTIVPAGPAHDHEKIELRSFSLRNAAGHTTPFYLLPGLHVDISASAIRAEIGRAPSHLTLSSDVVPSAVASYIRTHDLYR